MWAAQNLASEGQQWLTAGDPGIRHQELLRMSISAGFNCWVCNLLVFLGRPQSTWAFWATSWHTAFLPLRNSGKPVILLPLQFFLQLSISGFVCKDMKQISFKNLKNSPKLVRRSRLCLDLYFFLLISDADGQTIDCKQNFFCRVNEAR